jgi:hypothetical protein
MAWLVDEEMGDKQLCTVILRLVLDRWGTLLHGEVVDMAGDVKGRITTWDQVVAAVKACVASTDRT